MMDVKEAIKRIEDHVAVHHIGEYPHIKIAEALNVATSALQKQIPMEVTIKIPGEYCPPDYYCPVCGKQQKNTFKNRREGCFCERCGQKLMKWGGR